MGKLSIESGADRVALGIFSERHEAEHALELLRQRGFSNADVSVLFPAGPGLFPNGADEVLAHESGTKMPEAASTGAATGLVLGGVLGWLAGVGAIAIPGIGPFLAAGPILASLAGAGMGGALGGVAGGLVGIGIPEYEAERFEDRVRQGDLLVSIHCDNDVSLRRAEKVLVEAGAHDISTTSDIAADYVAADRPDSSASKH